MILLDTHVLIYLLFEESRLGSQTHRIIGDAWPANNVAVSAITFWEVAMLHEKGRMTLLRNIESWRTSLLNDGLLEIAVNGQIGIRANALPDFHPDPADRIIVATALEGHQLITADRRILEWPGPLNRLSITA